MKYLFCNWKMYLGLKESEALAKELAGASYDSEKLSVAVFPSYPSIPAVVKACEGGRVEVGAQDCYWVPSGAYTGAVSAQMLATLGCRYVMVGHSERRHIFGESDTDARKKIDAALDAGLAAVVCVGETKEELADGKREYRLKKQLMKAFSELPMNGKGIFVAYEPVWAIGTGEPCDPAEVERIHAFIRAELTAYGIGHIPLLYGGSVSPDNVKAYIFADGVDGVLAGGASAKSGSLMPLISSVL